MIECKVEAHKQQSPSVCAGSHAHAGTCSDISNFHSLQYKAVLRKACAVRHEMETYGEADADAGNNAIANIAKPKVDHWMAT